MSRWSEFWANIFDDHNDYYLSFKCLEKDGKLYSLGQWLDNNFEEETEEVNVVEVEDLLNEETTD